MSELSMLKCPQCAVGFAPGLLACPACRSLVYADRLKQLAAEAALATGQGDPAAEIRLWREALDLLPRDSTQYVAIAQRIAVLASAHPAVPAAPARGSGSSFKKAAASATALGLLLWKLKVILLFAITKGKLLLLGLTKSSTFLSMFLSFGVYWTAWGWPLRARARAVDLCPRDGPRRSPAAIWPARHRPHVHPRFRRHRPPQATPRQPR